jgi:predicted nuclease of restriction endonuclease-like (RecB) superfamily
MNSDELTLYRDLLGDIKTRVRAAQHRAARSANAEMIRLYWDIGRLIATRQEKEGWGAGVIPRLTLGLKNELPEEKGFSERNIKRMLRFYKEYSELPPNMPQAAALLETSDAQASANVPQPVAQSTPLFLRPVIQRSVAQIPWGHNILLFEKIPHLPTRLWYAEQALEQGWSRDNLVHQIKHQAHQRQGAAISNFSSTLSEPHAALAEGLLKDPYLFDFLTLEEPFHERELENGLLRHLEKFLLELGRGFAFVGRQYRLEVSDREYYLDLLFYHLELRCFIVIDLKKGDFKPE